MNSLIIFILGVVTGFILFPLLVIFIVGLMPEDEEHTYKDKMIDKYDKESYPDKFY
jgi:hypothetical protein